MSILSKGNFFKSRICSPIHLLLSLLILIHLSFSQNVTNVTQSGSTVLLTFGSDQIAIKPISERMVCIEYKNKSQTAVPSEIINPDLPQNISFTSTSITSDPILLKGAQFILKITKAPMTIEFQDQSGKSLFKSNVNGLSKTKLTGTTISGKYYGLRQVLATQQNNTKLTIGGQWSVSSGSQGSAGSPFLWTTSGFGLVNDVEKGSIDLSNIALTIIRDTLCQNSNHLFFLIAGNPHQIFQNYYIATGSYPLPPKWALGFMNSEKGINETEYKSIISNYRSKKIPIDVYLLDNDWYNETNLFGEYCWNATKWPSAPNGDLKKWNDERGIKMVGIRKPQLKTTSYDFYKADVQRDYWSNYINSTCNPFTKGIVGYWNSEADQYGGVFNSLYMQKSHYKGQRSYNNERVFSINRNYIGGAHRYAYGLWSGDINSNFETYTGMREHLLTSVNLGAAWWSNDIGGFNGHPTDETFIRWMQMGTFLPIYRVNGTSGEQRQPWVYGAESETICREFINLRYRLLPYIYNAFYRLTSEGLPPVRPFLFDYSSDSTLSHYVDGWLFGDHIAAFPVADIGATEKEIYLPSGAWYDFWTGSKFDGGMVMTAFAPLDRIPIYIKAGAIIPMSKQKQYYNEKQDDTLEIRIYQGDNGQMTLFEDDNTSYAYEKGAFSKIPMEWNESSKTLKIGARQGTFPGMLSSRVFNITFVKSGKGGGVEEITSPDRKITYSGNTINVPIDGSASINVLKNSINKSVKITTSYNAISIKSINQKQFSYSVISCLGKNVLSGYSKGDAVTLEKKYLSTGIYSIIVKNKQLSICEKILIK